MLYVNKNNQINFSEQELDFLNNFSSVEEVVNFCESQIENFASLKNRLLSEYLRKGTGDWLRTGDPKILAKIWNKKLDAGYGAPGGSSLHKRINFIKEKLSNPNLFPNTKEELLQEQEKLLLALRAAKRKRDLADVAENAIDHALANNKIRSGIYKVFYPGSERLDYKKIRDSLEAGLALDLMNGRVPYREVLKGPSFVDVNNRYAV